MKIPVIAALCAIFVLAPHTRLSAGEQEASPAIRLLEKMEFQKTAIESAVGMVELMIEHYPSSALTPEVIQEIRVACQKFMNNFFSDPDLFKGIAKIYEDNFTAAELEELIQLYDSPLGRKLIAAQPVVNQAAAKLTMKAFVEITKVIEEIMVKHEDAAPGDAQAATTTNSSTTMLEELRKAIREQEELVEERRKTLATIVRTKGIIITGEDAISGTHAADENHDASIFLQTFHQIEQEKALLESQIESLLSLETDNLIAQAAGLNVPDNVVRTLYPQYLELLLQLDSIKNSGLGPRHPTVLSHEDRIQGLRRQLEEGVVNLRATLRQQLDLATIRLARAETMKEEAREQAITRGLDAQDYVEAKKAFEMEQALLQQMRLKLIDVATDIGMPAPADR